MSKLVSIFLAGMALSGHALSVEEFSDAFINEQLEKAKLEPNNRVTLDIDQPIEVVYRALLSELPSYSDGVVSMLFDNSDSISRSEIDIGSKRISMMEDANILVQTIILFDPPNSFAYFTEMSESTISAPLDYSIGHYQLSEQANGRTSVEVSTVYKSNSRLTAFLVKLAFNRAFKQDFRKAEEYLNSIERR